MSHQKAKDLNLSRSQSQPEAKGGKAFRKKTNAANDQIIFEFLPAAAEVEHTPSSKAGNVIIWLIVSLFVIACVWAYFGRIDIVAIAQGKIDPSVSVKHIQPLETAKVTKIYVRDGQLVSQGQVLVELDSSQAQADVSRLNGELKELKYELDRLNLFTHWIEAPQTNLAFQRIEMNNQLPLHQRGLLLEEQNEVKARLLNLAKERESLVAEGAMIEAELEKQRRIVPVLAERVDALKQLHRKQFGSKVQYLEIKQELIEAEQNYAIQAARLVQSKASLKVNLNQGALYLAERRRQALTQYNETQVRSHIATQELTKAQERLANFVLSAPLAGEVQELAITTIGGVVTPAQAILAIVPTESEMEVEALILNKDIGFVSENQAVEIKVDTFNFTKYGLIEGRIRSISDDAIQDENLGLVYAAKIDLAEQGLTVQDRFVRLSPGMSVTAEVKTGTRRVIEFFLSPLLRYQQESLGER
jgi:hemolysin D